jgi:4-diphosphocytidyl-2-C-methyl-D-erythritol kinase
MCPVSLCDWLTFKDDPQGQDVTLRIDWAGGSRQSSELGAEELAEGSDNTIVRAVLALRERAGLARGAQLQLLKRIPVASGLAGGSTDAAAALLAANLGWQAGLRMEELAELAAMVGSDVPFFLQQRWAICRGRGERVTAVDRMPRLDLVLVRPRVGLSTAEVYSACEPAHPKRSVKPLVESLQQGSWKQAAGLLHNRLQPAAESLCPVIGQLAEAFADLDVIGHQMSGSGTSYFGLCRDARHARRMAALLAQRGVGKVYNVHTSR